MDLLRLELGPSFAFTPPSATLRRETVKGPDGHELYVYYRTGQRRRDPATDGDFCLGEPVTAAALERATVVVKPWWLYADYRAADPADRIAPDWMRRFPGFALVPGLLTEPDGKTPTTAVRVCREEAQTAETGTVYASGRSGAKKNEPRDATRGGVNRPALPGEPPADGKISPLSIDPAVARPRRRLPSAGSQP